MVSISLKVNDPAGLPALSNRLTVPFWPLPLLSGVRSVRRKFRPRRSSVSVSVLINAFGSKPPAPPSTTSPAVPPMMVSWSAPPLITSAPSPPVSRSRSSPPISVSLSSPPSRVSLPAPPSMKSLPSSPISESLPEPAPPPIVSSTGASKYTSVMVIPALLPADKD